MRIRLHRFVLHFASLVLLLAASGCVEPLSPDYGLENGVRMPIKILVPAPATPETKGPIPGNITSVGNESTLYDLHIWAFSHQAPNATDGDTERSVAYVHIPELNFSDWTGENNESKTFDAVLVFPEYIWSRPDNQLKMDFYVLANGESVGFKDAVDPRQLTRGQIKAMVFGDPADATRDWFGTHQLETSVSDKGLPMSGFFNNRENGYDISFLRDNPNPSPEKMAELQREWPSIQLKRAISRMRFIFSRSNTVSNLVIEGIELTDLDDGSGMIPSQTYLFPREVTPPGGIELPTSITYNSLSLGTAAEPLLTTDQIGKMDDPTELINEGNLAAQIYESALQDHLERRHATAEVIYLRESDKPMMGRIHYKVGNDHYSSTFSMVGLKNTNFFRNHSWTVFAYMVGQHMVVKVKVDYWNVPWEKKSQVVDESLSLVVDQDGKFTMDGEMVKTGYGYDITLPPAPDDTVKGRVAIYAPKTGRLVITPVAYEGFAENESVTDWFDISTDPADPVIDPAVNEGIIQIRVCRKSKTAVPTVKKSIRLTFSVIIGGRTIAADSEIIDDKYYFIIPKSSN